ncbi:protein slit-like [Xenia sp. Carnegie-2017]|uniref:protein slit-like n=1 Tax=Xenia sp. Carnegie-2017 TaxID=2897299 RepID=UPI001F03A608|nr:protein slit-like [Xenia sp. Carnegie-2017]
MVSNSERLCVCFVVILSVLQVSESKLVWGDCRKYRHYPRSLYCNNIRARSVPYDLFETPYTSIFLRNNPYVCDCKMSWFLKRLRLKDYTQLLVDVRRMKCHEPERLRGKRIYKLKEEDVCSKKMIMNECKLQIDQCHQHADCHDQNRGYRCSCRTGFTGSGWNCSDIDECRQNGVCSKANTKCVNTWGTYLCYCDRGFMLKNSKCEDINECSEGTATCPRHAICKNTKGSYTCTCKNGYVVKGSKTCAKKEIVTCSSSPGPCDFLTEDCIQGQSLGRYNCRCKKGFTRSDNGVCTDINECNKNHELCESIAECKNTPGSYKCICPEGYEAADEDTCDDIDECATGMDNCHRDAVCINNIGSYSCLCKKGFLQYKNGRLCLKEDQEDSITTPIIILPCVMFVGVLGTFTCCKLCRGTSKTDQKKLINGKSRFNWLSHFKFPQASMYGVPTNESMISVWSDSDDEK